MRADYAIATECGISKELNGASDGIGRRSKRDGSNTGFTPQGAAFIDPSGTRPSRIVQTA